MPTPAKRKFKLKESDYILLSIVQQDRYKKPQELSKLVKERSNEQVKLGAAACRKRLDVLEKRGIIARNCAILNPAAFDCEQICFMLVKALVRTEEGLKRFTDNAIADESVLELHAIAGPFDYIIKARVAGVRDAHRLSKKLGIDVATIETLTVGDTFKETTALKLR